MPNGTGSRTGSTEDRPDQLVGGRSAVVPAAATRAGGRGGGAAYAATAGAEAAGAEEVIRRQTWFPFSMHGGVRTPRWDPCETPLYSKVAPARIRPSRCRVGPVGPAQTPARRAMRARELPPRSRTATNGDARVTSESTPGPTTRRSTHEQHHAAPAPARGAARAQRGGRRDAAAAPASPSPTTSRPRRHPTPAARAPSAPPPPPPPAESGPPPPPPPRVRSRRRRAESGSRRRRRPPPPPPPRVATRRRPRRRGGYPPPPPPQGGWSAPAAAAAGRGRVPPRSDAPGPVRLRDAGGPAAVPRGRAAPQQQGPHRAGDRHRQHRLRLLLQPDRAGPRPGRRRARLPHASRDRRTGVGKESENLALGGLITGAVGVVLSIIAFGIGASNAFGG